MDLKNSDWKKIDFSFLAELHGCLLVLAAVFLVIPMLIWLLFSEGHWAAALSLIGLLTCPAVTFTLWARGAPEKIVRRAAIVTIVAIPIFIAVETLAFLP